MAKDAHNKLWSVYEDIRPYSNRWNTTIEKKEKYVGEDYILNPANVILYKLCATIITKMKDIHYLRNSNENFVQFLPMTIFSSTRGLD